MSQANAAFDLLVLGDFLAGRSGRVQTIHKDDLDAWFKAAAPTIGDLRFESYRELRPDSIAQRAGACAPLLELRAALQEAAKGKRSAEDVLAMLASWTGPASVARAVRDALGTTPENDGTTAQESKPAEPAPSSTDLSSGDDPLAAIFAQVDLPKSDAPRAPAEPTALEGLLGGILGRGSGGSGKASLAGALKLVEAELAASVQSAMGKDFRALESAWLGLRFLSRRLDHRAGVHLHAVPTAEKDLVRTLREVALPFVEEARDEGRTFVLLADFDLTLESAAAIAKELEPAAVPMIASVDPGALGFGSRDALLSSGDLSQPAAEWSALRSEPASRWLALGVNRMLGRAPYGAKSDGGTSFAFEEPLDDLPWIRATWAIGERLAASAVRTGWCLDCVGAGEGGTIEDLPLRPLVLRSGDEIACGLEALLSEQRLLELSRLGLVPLATRRNDDKAFLATAPLLFAPTRGADDRANQIDARRATLPYQLMVTQIMTLVRQIYPHLDPNASAFDLVSTLAGGLKLLTLSATGPLFDIAATAPAADDANARTMGIRLTPLRDPMRGLPDFELELPLPGRR